MTQRNAPWGIFPCTAAGRAISAETALFLTLLFLFCLAPLTGSAALADEVRSVSSARCLKLQGKPEINRVRCTGPSGYSVLFAEDDGTSSVHAGHAGREEKLDIQGMGGWLDWDSWNPNVRQVEWRVRDGRPIAAIIEAVSVTSSAQFLVVASLSGSSVCALAMVKAEADGARTRARAIADYRASSFACDLATTAKVSGFSDASPGNGLFSAPSVHQIADGRSGDQVGYASGQSERKLGGSHACINTLVNDCRASFSNQGSSAGTYRERPVVGVIALLVSFSLILLLICLERLVAKLSPADGFDVHPQTAAAGKLLSEREADPQPLSIANAKERPDHGPR